MPDTGMPMLSTIAAISRDGMISRIAFWRAANWLAASSTRVPTGARACIRIRPASTVGKKLRPSIGARANEASTNAMKPAMKVLRLARAIASRSR